MAADEADYMKALSRVAARGGGRVLEVGYGLGISARYLSDFGVLQHVVCEPNLRVFNSSMRHAKNVAPRTSFSPILGFWQEILSTLRTGSFDGVLFDAFPDTAEADFFREARRLLRPGGVLTFYHSACDTLGHDLKDTECRPWEEVVEMLLASGWGRHEISEEEPAAIVLEIDNQCACAEGSGVCAKLAGKCGSRPRTFVTPVITRAVDDAQGESVEPPTDRALLEAAQRASFASRVDIVEDEYYTRSAWQTSNVQFQQYISSDERTEATPLSALLVGDHVVMDSEEAVYMHDLVPVAITSHQDPELRNGRLLELGFGLGTSARAFQAAGVREHLILEANIAVMQALLESDVVNKPGVRVVLGFWQEMAPTLADGAFDSIFFDPYPNDDDQTTESVMHQRHFMGHAYRLLRPGGLFVYMSGDASASSIARDRTAALAAGFAPADIEFYPKEYRMIDACDAYPDCPIKTLEMLMTRLAKAPPPPPSICVHYNDILQANSYTALDDSAPLFKPDGPTFVSAPLADVLEDTTGALAPLPLVHASDLHDRAASEIMAYQLPFVVRGHPAAQRVAAQERWTSAGRMCTGLNGAPEQPLTHLCSMSGTTHHFNGRQFHFVNGTGPVDEEADGELFGRESGLRKPTRTTDVQLGQFLSVEGGQRQLKPSELNEQIIWWGNLTTGDESHDSILLASEPEIYEALVPIAGPVGMRDANLARNNVILRIGRADYGSSFHFDGDHNWITSLSGWKRAVLMHPAHHSCIGTDLNKSSQYYRHSPLPLTDAREWLAANCPPDRYPDQPRAFQHVFEPGDLLFIPATWLHAIETRPADAAQGWWASLNRFVEAYERCDGPFTVSVDTKRSLAEVLTARPEPRTGAWMGLGGHG